MERGQPCGYGLTSLPLSRGDAERCYGKTGGTVVENWVVIKRQTLGLKTEANVEVPKTAIPRPSS